MLDKSFSWLKVVYKYIYRQKLIDVKLAEQFKRISNDDLESFNPDNIVSTMDKKQKNKFDIRQYERFAGGKIKVKRIK